MKVIKTMRKTDGYRLMIKIYEPETEVKGFIVGVHGFGGYIALQCMDSLPPETRIVLRAPAVNAHETFCRLLDMEDEDLLDLPAPEAFLRELEEEDIFHKYFDRPMLLIQGDQDELVTHEEAMAFCNHNPKAALEIVEGLGHQITYDAENNQVIAIAEKYLLHEEV